MTLPEGGFGPWTLKLGEGRCAFRPHRVVFVLGRVSSINSLTSGKKSRCVEHAPLWVSYCGLFSINYFRKKSTDPYILARGGVLRPYKVTFVSVVLIDYPF